MSRRSSVTTTATSPATCSRCGDSVRCSARRSADPGRQCHSSMQAPLGARSIMADPSTLHSRRPGTGKAETGCMAMSSGPGCATRPRSDGPHRDLSPQVCRWCGRCWPRRPRGPPCRPGYERRLLPIRVAATKPSTRCHCCRRRSRSKRVARHQEAGRGQGQARPKRAGLISRDGRDDAGPFLHRCTRRELTTRALQSHAASSPGPGALATLRRGEDSRRRPVRVGRPGRRRTRPRQLGRPCRSG